jgi:hypothetical protein
LAGIRHFSPDRKLENDLFLAKVQPVGRHVPASKFKGWAFSLLNIQHETNAIWPLLAASKSIFQEV